MYSNIKIFLPLLALVLFCSSVLAQDTTRQDQPKRGRYALVLYAGGGISRFTGSAGTPLGVQANTTLQHPIGTFRVMWHPDHFLRVGIETGKVVFYSYTVDDAGIKGDAMTSAVPIIVVFSIPFGKHLSLYGGPGSYLMRSDLDYGSSVHSTSHSLGWMAALGYTIPISHKVAINTEVKYLKASTTKDEVLTVQLHLQWKFLEW
jgi:opacity protein-like surface antigen